MRKIVILLFSVLALTGALTVISSALPQFSQVAMAGDFGGGEGGTGSGGVDIPAPGNGNDDGSDHNGGAVNEGSGQNASTGGNAVNNGFGYETGVRFDGNCVGYGNTTACTSYSRWTESTWSGGTAQSWGCPASSGTGRGGEVVGATRQHVDQTINVVWYTTETSTSWSYDPIKGWTQSTSSYSQRHERNDVTRDYAISRPNCKFAPNYVDSRVTCVLDSTITIKEVLPNPQVMVNKSQDTAFKGNRTVSNCLNSTQRINANVDVTRYSRVELNSRTNMVNCYARSYSQGYVNGSYTTPATELVNCGTPYANPSYNRGQLLCTGWTTGVNSWSQPITPILFTESYCGETNVGSGPVTYECPKTLPTVNGVTNTTRQDVLARGVNINGMGTTIEYGTPNITSPQLRGIISTQTHVQRTGTPDAKGYSGEAMFNLMTQGTNTSILDSPTEWSTWVPGLHTKWDARFYGASDVDKPTVLMPQYQYTVDMNKQSVTISSVNPINGSWTTTPKNVVVRTTALCNDTPLTLNALRGAVDVSR